MNLISTKNSGGGKWLLSRSPIKNNLYVTGILNDIEIQRSPAHLFTQNDFLKLIQLKVV